MDLEKRERAERPDEVRIEGGLAFVKSDFIEDWYLIERAEHDGSEWYEPSKIHGWSVHCYMRAGRITDADVEGTPAEMLDIALAIRHRSSFSAKRCAVEVRDDGVAFWSPRNSNDSRGIVSLEVADALASVIESKFS